MICQFVAWAAHCIDLFGFCAARFRQVVVVLIWGRMMLAKICAAVFLAGAVIVLGGCSPEAKAGLRSWAFTPTTYQERTWLYLAADGPSTGYDDKQIDETTFVVNSVVSEVTTVQQAQDLALVHAAKLGESRNFSHFIVDRARAQMRCTMHYGNPVVELTVKYGSESDFADAAKRYVIADVIADLMPKVRNPDASTTAKETAYIANMRLCRSGGQVPLT